MVSIPFFDMKLHRCDLAFILLAFCRKSWNRNYLSSMSLLLQMNSVSIFSCSTMTVIIEFPDRFPYQKIAKKNYLDLKAFVLWQTNSVSILFCSTMTVNVEFPDGFYGRTSQIREYLRTTANNVCQLADEFF